MGPSLIQFSGTPGLVPEQATHSCEEILPQPGAAEIPYKTEERARTVPCLLDNDVASTSFLDVICVCDFSHY